VIWWVLFAITVAAQAALQSWAVLIGGFAVSTVAACWYLRRKSVPRRARHRPF
jgi:membrane protein implicated in regulation of membrane protease activity